MDTINIWPQSFGGPTIDTELPKLFAEEMFDPRDMGIVAGLNGVRLNWNLWLAPEETVLRSDEVTREAVSFSAHPVVLAITDEQAVELRQFKDGSSAAESV